MMKRPKEGVDKWLTGMKEEMENFEKRGMWRKIKQSQMPEGRRRIGSKWVYKVKRNETFRSRLVSLGCTQQPGVDFTDNFSPEVHEMTLRIALIVWLVLDLDVDPIDVETAFLEGELDESERVYLTCPPGMELGNDECLKICKGLYGLVQFLRIYSKKMCKVLGSLATFHGRSGPSGLPCYG